MIEKKTSSVPDQNPFIMERLIKLKDHDRTFDIQFWQAQTSQARFEAAWQLIESYHLKKGKTGDALRLQRSVESFQRKTG